MMMRIALAPAAVAGAQVPDIPPTVSKVHPGPDGKLVYVPDEQGNTIFDFSYAGYGAGGTPIPAVPVKETVWPVAGDNQANLQAAIDKPSTMGFCARRPPAKNNAESHNASVSFICAAATPRAPSVRLRRSCRVGDGPARASRKLLDPEA